MPWVGPAVIEISLTSLVAGTKYRGEFEERLEAVVREAIQQLVAAENPAKPLSDESLMKALAKQGIKVARRTIAKYREQLNILPSHLRKTF